MFEISIRLFLDFTFYILDLTNVDVIEGLV